VPPSTQAQSSAKTYVSIPTPLLERFSAPSKAANTTTAVASSILSAPGHLSTSAFSAKAKATLQAPSAALGDGREQEQEQDAAVADDDEAGAELDDLEREMIQAKAELRRNVNGTSNTAVQPPADTGRAPSHRVPSPRGHPPTQAYGADSSTSGGGVGGRATGVSLIEESQTLNKRNLLVWLRSNTQEVRATKRLVY
jgi:hypothetical protein